ncbi:MAG: NifB/NifX family molybdenum-iron cluster-binding protein [Desulfovibrionales bacterium]
MVFGSSTTGTTVCLAAFNDRLASLFYTAMSFKIYVRQDGGLVHQGQVMLPGRDPYFRARALLDCKVDVLICGAISSRMLRLLRQSGIEVLPWFKGTLAEVLDAWCASDLERLTMPGCRPDRINRSRSCDCAPADRKNQAPGGKRPPTAIEPEKT